MAGALSRVQGRDWIQESYETGDPSIRKRTAALKKLGYRAKSFPMGEQVTQWGRVKMTMVDIRPGSSQDSYLENVPRSNPKGGAVTKKKTKKKNTTAKRKPAKKKNAGPQSRRKTIKRMKKSGAFSRYGYAKGHETGNFRELTRGKGKKKSSARSKSNPSSALRAKLRQMKPHKWYPTTLSGAKVKVQRKGQSLIIRPATKRRSR